MDLEAVLKEDPRLDVAMVELDGRSLAHATRLAGDEVRHWQARAVTRELPLAAGGSVVAVEELVALGVQAPLHVVVALQQAHVPRQGVVLGQALAVSSGAEPESVRDLYQRPALDHAAGMVEMRRAEVRQVVVERDALLVVEAGVRQADRVHQRGSDQVRILQRVGLHAIEARVRAIVDEVGVAQRVGALVVVIEQPEVDLVAVCDVVVDARQVLVVVAGLADLGHEAAIAAVFLRERHPSVEHELRDRVQQVRGDDVVRERVARVGVLNRASPGKDARPLVTRGRERIAQAVFADALALIRELEEGLVLDDRAAHGAAELVEAELGHGARKEVAGIERVVTEEVPQAPVELVGARSRYGADHAEAATVLGSDARRRDAELLHRVGRRQDQALAAMEVAHRAAVQQVVDREVAAAIDVHVLLAEGRPDRRADPLHAGHEPNQVERVAAVERQVLDPPVVDCHADLRRAGVDLRSLARDRHSLGDLSQLQDEVHPQALQRRQGDARSLNGPKALGLHRRHVAADLHLGREVVAGRSGLDDFHLAGVLVEKGDLNPRHGGTGRVRHSARDFSRGGLAERSGCCQ